MTPEQRKALGARLRDERDRRHLNRPELARLIISALIADDDHQHPDVLSMATYIKRWEAGTVDISTRYRRAYAKALEIPLTETFPPASAGSLVPTIDGHAENEYDMERRRLLQLVAMGTGVGLENLASGWINGISPGQASDALRSTFDSALPQNMRADNTADDWQEVAFEYSQACLTTTPKVLLPDLAADCLALQGVIKQQGSSRRISDLYGAAAVLAAIMAETINGLGMSRESRHWWRSARHAADASGDFNIRTWVYGQEAMNSLYQERPFPIVLDKAEAAIRVASGNSSAGLLEALACKAQAFAEMGDVSSALAVLAEMRNSFDDLPDDIRSDRLSRMVWPEHRLLHTESYVYTSTGDTLRAAVAQERVLSIYPSSRVRPRAQIELHRAACLVKDGDTRTGLSHAERVLAELPPGYRTKSVQVIAGKVLSPIPRAEEKNPAVSSFRELLTLIASPQGV